MYWVQIKDYEGSSTKHYKNKKNAAWCLINATVHKSAESWRKKMKQLYKNEDSMKIAREKWKEVMICECGEYFLKDNRKNKICLFCKRRKGR